MDAIEEKALGVLAYLRGFDDAEMADRCGIGPEGEDCGEYIEDHASDLAYVTSALRDAAELETP